MSVPVRYFPDTLYHHDNNNCLEDRSRTESAEVRWQRVSEGRLGMPDAAASNLQNSLLEIPNQQQQHQQQQHDFALQEQKLQQQQQLQLHHQQLNEEQQQQYFYETLTNDPLYNKLMEYTALEGKFQPCLYLPKESHNGEITIGARDGAAHVLRCLKVWYDLPSDVLFTAINLVDRFLTKMKVKPKHLACISVGSFHLAINQLNIQKKISCEDLVTISQCRCTSGDLERMGGIIANKLGVQMNSEPITALSFVRLIFYMLQSYSHQVGMGEFFDNSVNLPDLELRLEILTCDTSCANIRAAELALSLIYIQLEAGVAKAIGSRVGNNSSGGGVDNNDHEAIANLLENNNPYQSIFSYAHYIQNFCRISHASLCESFGCVVDILSRYNGQHKMPYRQRLVWKLSSRTMRVLRPTDKLTSHLPTIVEHKTAISNNSLSARFRTGSVSSEEGEDWPTSPVVAVYEEC